MKSVFSAFVVAGVYARSRAQPSAGVWPNDVFSKITPRESACAYHLDSGLFFSDLPAR